MLGTNNSQNLGFTKTLSLSRQNSMNHKISDHINTLYGAIHYSYS